jgi:hypothetical protein
MVPAQSKLLIIFIAVNVNYDSNETHIKRTD